MTRPGDRRRYRRVDDDAEELLEDEIDYYLSRGYSVAAETSTSASLVKPKRFGCLIFVLLFLLGIFPAVIYVAWYASRRDQTVYLRIEDGRVRRGGQPGMFSEMATGLIALWSRMSPRVRLVLVGVVLVTVALTVGITLLRDDSGSARPAAVATRTASPSRPAPAATTTTLTPTPEATPATYTIIAGDTLAKLAVRFDTTVAVLADLNGIGDASAIEVGQVPTLPSGASAAAITTPRPASTSSTSSPGGRCLAVSRALVGIISEGLTGSGSIREAWAVRSRDFEQTYFVAADLQGPSLGGSDEIAVWVSNRLDGSGLIFSVNGLAGSFSDWGDGGRTEAGFSMSDDGAREAVSCVSTALGG